MIQEKCYKCGQCAIGEINLHWMDGSGVLELRPVCNVHFDEHVDRETPHEPTPCASCAHKEKQLEEARALLEFAEHVGLERGGIYTVRQFKKLDRWAKAAKIWLDGRI